MARRSRKKTRTRDAFAVPSPPRGLRSEISKSGRHVGYLGPLQDRRQFHPEGANRPLGVRRRPSRYLVAGRPSVRERQRVKRYRALVPAAVVVFGDPPARIEAAPELTMCERRRQRREVLHALRHSGKGGQKKPRWTQESHLSCRRRR